MGHSGAGFNEDGTPERISTGLGAVVLPASGPQTRVFPNALEFKPAGINNDFTVVSNRGNTKPYSVTIQVGSPLNATWSGSATQNLVVTIPADGSATANAVIGEINTKIGGTWASLGFDGDPNDPNTLYDETHYAPPGGDPPNHRGFQAGYCSYCHDDDGATDINGDPAPALILNNHDTHHGINLPSSVAKGTPGNPAPGGTWSKCNVCHEHTTPPRNGSYHDVGGPQAALHIRVCEECHSVESLHNIQADSDGNGMVPGTELAGYGHVGRDAGPGDSDCWGCHGFEFPSSSSLAPFTGPIIPTLFNADVATIPAGRATMVVLSGAGFTNRADGKLYESNVRLTASDGSSVTLKPELVLDQGNLAVTIPAKTRPGNYRLQATKGTFASNPAVISVSPVARISRATYRGTVTILGTGFGGYAEGSPTSVTGTVTAGSGRRARTKTVTAKIVSWTDTNIVVDFGTLPGNVTVNSVFGSATASVSRR